MCLPLFLHSSWSLSLLSLCIQNHPRAKIYLLVLEPPSKLKPADGFNVSPMGNDLLKVPKYTPSSRFRNYEHCKKVRGGTSGCVYLGVNTEYSFLSRVIPFLLMLYFCILCMVLIYSALMCTVFVKCVR